MNYIFENKKYLFLNDITNICSLAHYSFFIFLLLFDQIKKYFNKQKLANIIG
jgi:hypothetical protein